MIRNVVFDIGNVLVRWDPALIVERTFGKEKTNDTLVESIFPGDNTWIPLNLGKITAEEAMQSYRNTLGFSIAETDLLWHNILDTQILFTETVELMKSLSKAGYRIFALSDNVHEIVAYVKSYYDFWRFFEGVVISAEVGLLKPDEMIYRHLLSEYDLTADETLFMDDMPKNVAGAKSVGINAFQFSTAQLARTEMAKFQINLN